MRHYVLIFAALLPALVLAQPGPVAADEAIHRFQAKGGEFLFSEAGLRIVQTIEEQVVEMWISVEGELSIDAQSVPVDKKQRKLLKSFVRESGRMAEWIEEVGRSVSVQVDSTATSEARAKAARRITSTGKKLEKQNVRVAALAIDLAERIPELAPLFRLLGD